MDILGNLTTGAGVTTRFQQNYAHQFLVIGDGLTPPDLNGINVTQGGDVTQRIDISGNTEIMEVYSQLIAREVMGLDPAGNQLGYVIPINDGFNPDPKMLYSIVNGAAQTPEVRAYSMKRGTGKFVRSGMEEINANSSQWFYDFDYLIFDDANFDYADITFGDGHQEGGMDEIAMGSLAMLGGPLPNDIGGGNVIVVDNSDKRITGILLNVTGGGALTVINTKLG